MNFICLEFNHSLCIIIDGREIMKVATFNANSIRSRLPIICDWITMHDPDILGIQETKVQDSDFPKEIFLKLGFKTEFLGQKSYNGVCILFNKKAELYCMNVPGLEDEQKRLRVLSGRLSHLFADIYWLGQPSVFLLRHFSRSSSCVIGCLP